MSRPTRTFLPISKPKYHGVYYVGSLPERVLVTETPHGLVARGGSYPVVNLQKINDPWWIPVLPPIQDCIDYVKIAGWVFTGYRGGLYHFEPKCPHTATCSHLTFTLSEMRDAYRHGF